MYTSQMLNDMGVLTICIWVIGIIALIWALSQM